MFMISDRFEKWKYCLVRRIQINNIKFLTLLLSVLDYEFWTYKRRITMMTTILGASNNPKFEEASWDARLLWAYHQEQRPMVEALHCQSAYMLVSYFPYELIAIRRPLQVFFIEKPTVSCLLRACNYCISKMLNKCFDMKRTLSMNSIRVFITWDRAHSRTVRILSWSGWKHIPTILW